MAPYADLQDAVDDAADGDVLYLCPGTYDRIELDRVELGLVGDDPETTTIDGGSHTAVYVTESTLSMSGIGLTGQADGRSEESLAAGLYLSETTFTGTNLLVRDCSGTGYGVSAKASDTSFDGLRIEDNALTGGFVATSGGTLLMQHVMIARTTPATATLGGQALYVDTDAFEVSNLLAYENEGADGIAIVELQDASSGWFYNAVIQGNDTRGAALGVRGSATTVENVIVADNPASIGISAGSGAVVEYSDAWANLTNFEGDAAGGTGNLSGDPRFVDAAGGDFTLDAGFSPCVNTGNPLAGYNDADGSRNDMGAYGGPLGNAW